MCGYVDENVNFSWDFVEDAEDYRIQVAQPDFDNTIQIVLDSIVTSTTNFTQTLSSGNYQWRVRADNSGYSTAYTTNSFAVESTPEDISSAQVTLLAPAIDLTFTTSDTLSFSWESAPGANSYTIQIASPNFESATVIVEDINQTGSSFTTTELDAGSYEWRVRAENSEYQTPYSTRSFTIEE